jgi:hypothetical protein
MEPQGRRSLARDAEDVIRRLHGVSAARVELGDDGEIEQVHVLGSGDRTARVLVGDVIAAVAAELGIALDPPRVRVAILRAGQAQPGPAPRRARLKFVGLTVTTLGQTTEATVRIEHEGLTYEGMASGANGLAHTQEVIGLATVHAVETYLRAEAVFSLKLATVLPLAPHQVALALVAWLGPDEELLSGTAMVHDDPRDAVVRAVLDAVNRPVGWLGPR